MNISNIEKLDILLLEANVSGALVLWLKRLTEFVIGPCH